MSDNDFINFGALEGTYQDLILMAHGLREAIGHSACVFEIHERDSLLLVTDVTDPTDIGHFYRVEYVEEPNEEHRIGPVVGRIRVPPPFEILAHRVIVDPDPEEWIPVAELAQLQKVEQASRYTPGRPLTGVEERYLTAAIKDVIKAYKSILGMEEYIMEHESAEVAHRLAAARGLLDEVAGFLQTAEQGRRYSM